MSNSLDPEWHKTGIAKDVKMRRNSFQTGNRKDLKMEWYCLTPYFRKIEKHCRNKLEREKEFVKTDLNVLKPEIENYKPKLQVSCSTRNLNRLYSRNFCYE